MGSMFKPKVETPPPPPVEEAPPAAEEIDLKDAENAEQKKRRRFRLDQTVAKNLLSSPAPSVPARKTLG